MKKGVPFLRYHFDNFVAQRSSDGMAPVCKLLKLPLVLMVVEVFVHRLFDFPTLLNVHICCLPQSPCYITSAMSLYHVQFSAVYFLVLQRVGHGF